MCDLWPSLAGRRFSQPARMSRAEAVRPAWFASLSRSEHKAMTTYSPGRGRKKAVRRFTSREGIWMVGIIAAALIGMILLWLLGIFNFEMN